MIQEILRKKHVLHARIPMGLVHIACQGSEWIGKLLKKSMTLNTDKYIILKQRNWICDVTPLQDELGFVPAYPLRRGLEESIEWYRKKVGCRPAFLLPIRILFYFFNSSFADDFLLYGCRAFIADISFTYDCCFQVVGRMDLGGTFACDFTVHFGHCHPKP